MKGLMIFNYSLFAVSVLILIAIFLRYRRIKNQFFKLKKESKDLLKTAEKEVADFRRKAEQESQQFVSKSRREIEDEVKNKRQSISQIENRILQKEKYLDEKEVLINEKEKQLEFDKDKLKTLKKKEETLIHELSLRLENVAGLTKEQAEKLLLENVEKEVKEKAGILIKNRLDQAKKVANRRVIEIITDAMQRTAVDHVTAITTSVVQLPDDDMKGRVIGKEGRNIRAFEAQTGVDIIIDDTPGTVVLSAFDPIRRQIATISLEMLLGDGRIHPTRIEETTEKARQVLKERILEHGERASEEVGQQFSPEIIECLGKLYYRSSYGQNILNHSLEAAHISGIIATQLGVNVHLAKRGALLHDIGKAVDFELEGSHTELGRDICKRNGESDEILNCIMAHHEEEEPDTVEAIIVMIADALSSVRPGARRESLETYVKRLERLEKLATEFNGVEKAYAIQAGREVRVLVKPEEVNDNNAAKLAFDMARKIENELEYPGEVKVSIIRETRASAVAR